MKPYTQKLTSYHKLLYVGIMLLFCLSFSLSLIPITAEAAVKTGKVLESQAKQACNKDKNGKVSSNTCVWAYKKAYASQNVSCSASSLPSWAKSTDQSKLFAARVSCESGKKLGSAAKQKDSPNKKQAQKDIEKYIKDCSNYNPSKDKNTTCKNIRNRLISAGCNLGTGKGKTEKSKLTACKKTIEREITKEDAVKLKSGAGQDDISLEPLSDIGVSGEKADQDNAIKNITNIVFGIAGSLAVLFVVIGGMRYVISRGDPQATAQAKNTILYALIGLIVTIFAFTIVRFVISRLT